MASLRHFHSIPRYKILFHDVVKGRVGCNILFCTPLRILGESPSQSGARLKMFSTTLSSLAFLNSRRAIFVLCIIGRLKWCAINRRANFGCYVTLSYYTQSNLETSTPCTTSLVVGSKIFLCFEDAHLV